jgi:hypothetical protein
MAAKLKKGDKVVVLAGKDKGKQGEITRVMPKDNKAVVDGINISIRHTKQSATSPGRPHPAGDADRSVEPRHRGQERQGDPRRLPRGGRQEGPFSPRRPGRRSDARHSHLYPASEGAFPREHPPALKEEFGYKNDMMIPRLDKIVLNMGIGEAVKDTKKVKSAQEDLTAIAGQKAVITKAKKSIAGFRVREEMPLGVKVTLRGDRMYEFLDRLVTIACRASATSAASSPPPSTGAATTPWA